MGFLNRGHVALTLTIFVASGRGTTGYTPFTAKKQSQILRMLAHRRRLAQKPAAGSTLTEGTPPPAKTTATEAPAQESITAKLDPYDHNLDLVTSLKSDIMKRVMALSTHSDRTYTEKTEWKVVKVASQVVAGMNYYFKIQLDQDPSEGG